MGGVVIELFCGSALPVKVAPAAEWDGARHVLRWRVQGLPPSGRALLRAEFPPGGFPQPAGGAPSLHVAVLMPFSLTVPDDAGSEFKGAGSS